MTFHRHYLVGLLPLVLVLGLFAIPAGCEAGGKEDQTPRLLVLVFFDQLRGDYLTRWDELFGDEGFHRLEKEGAWFQNCHYPYAETVTAVGHASVATGCSPRIHGIIHNDWYDRTAGTSVYCVSSERYQRVPPPFPSEEREGGKKRAKGISPERLLAPTISDAVKQATGGKARVVSLSLKDRSAVAPAGQHPDACYWMDAASGQVVTSTYYRDRLHPWAAEFNRSRAVNAWQGTKWTRLRPQLEYEKYSGPDDASGEGTLLFSRTFPHALPDGAGKLKSAYYGALYNSPFGNDLLWALARKAIEGEQLGKHDQADLLCISFSSNDPIGHCWGPDSQEVLDVTLRSDDLVKEMLHYLDGQVGRGRYFLVLTADHGICPLPEAARRRGEDGGQIDPTALVRRASSFLTSTFHTPAEDNRWIETTPGPWLYLNRALLARHHLKQEEVEKALADWLEQQPGIQKAPTRSQLLAGIPADDALGQSVRQSFFPERSGDVYIVEKPNYLMTKQLTGTNHGTPHSYDTHVPLLVYGPNVRPGVRHEAVTPLASAVILAHALGIHPPAKAEAKLPEGLFSDRVRE